VCERKEDGEVMEKWGVCAPESQRIYSDSTPDPLPSRVVGKPRLLHRIHPQILHVPLDR